MTVTAHSILANMAALAAWTVQFVIAHGSQY
jgi:hypothetical protein